MFTLQPDPAGNPEGIAFDKRSSAFFVGITAGGAIYRGTLGSDTLAPFIAGATGKAAIGLKVRRGKLYVAGGPTGTITVYDLATKQPVATFETGTGGFLNDLVVTRRGDVYVTDSFRPTLWHVTAEQVRAGSGTPQALDVSAIPYEAGEFNLNGIVAKGGRTLVVVDSNSGKLFRIELGDDRASIDEIDEIEGATVPGGDGMLLDRGRLVVVQGEPRTAVVPQAAPRRARGEARAHADERQAPRPVDGRRGEGALPRRQRRLRHQPEAVHRGGAPAALQARPPLTEGPPPPEGRRGPFRATRTGAPPARSAARRGGRA